MKVGIYESKILHTREIEEILAQHNIESFRVTASNIKFDYVITLGGDRGLRNYFHDVVHLATPILGIAESDSNEIITQISLKNFHTLLPRLKKKNYHTEQVPSIDVNIDDKNTFHVLNDFAIFPSKSAVMMEHTLSINGQNVWHDSGDGIIVCTPLGSSAYSMSAGGPMLFQDSKVFGIVPVNSLDVTRRPLVVSDSSTVLIDDIYSSIHCDVVLDGIRRVVVKNKVVCTKSTPRHLVRFDKKATTISVLAKKVQLADDLLKMPPSFKLLLKTLEYEGQLTKKELSAKTLLPERTIRLALSHLVSKGYIRRKLSQRDARQRIYETIL